MKPFIRKKALQPKSDLTTEVLTPEKGLTIDGKSDIYIFTGTGEFEWMFTDECKKQTRRLLVIVNTQGFRATTVEDGWSYSGFSDEMIEVVSGQTAREEFSIFVSAEEKTIYCEHEEQITLLPDVVNAPLEETDTPLREYLDILGFSNKPIEVNASISGLQKQAGEKNVKYTFDTDLMPMYNFQIPFDNGIVKKTLNVVRADSVFVSFSLPTPIEGEYYFDTTTETNCFFEYKKDLDAYVFDTMKDGFYKPTAFTLLKTPYHTTINYVIIRGPFIVDNFACSILFINKIVKEYIEFKFITFNVISLVMNFPDVTYLNFYNCTFGNGGLLEQFIRGINKNKEVRFYDCIFKNTTIFYFCTLINVNNRMLFNNCKFINVYINILFFNTETISLDMTNCVMKNVKISSIAYRCIPLEEINLTGSDWEGVTLSEVLYAGKLFHESPNVKRIVGGFPNLRVSIDLSDLEFLELESVMDIFNSVASFPPMEKGPILTLNTNVVNKLTPEQIAIIQSKNWNLATIG